MNRPADLVLGSVQLGLEYGAANRSGKPERDAALKLVRRAADAGVEQFDTARAYGDAEERLGDALAHRSARTITKLSPLADLAPDAPAHKVNLTVDASIAASLAALRRPQLDCLLLHRAGHMSEFGGAVWRRLNEHLRDGTILSLGVSVQAPDEARTALSCAEVQHIQLPFNILDWRWQDAGIVQALQTRPNVTVHARSIFLQGLLPARDASLWPAIQGCDPAVLIRWLDETARGLGRDGVADLCLAYVRGQAWIDGVVVGMETEEQLETNLRLSVRPPLALRDCRLIESTRPRVPTTLLNPALWPKGAS